jgi:hypothetical protein
MLHYSSCLCLQLEHQNHKPLKIRGLKRCEVGRPAVRSRVFLRSSRGATRLPHFFCFVFCTWSFDPWAFSRPWERAANSERAGTSWSERNGDGLLALFLQNPRPELAVLPFLRWRRRQRQWHIVRCCSRANFPFFFSFDMEHSYLKV